MKPLDMWIVDSFTEEAFRGNPAAVHWTQSELDPQRMQSIASEMNLSETAFVRKSENANEFFIRYFSPLMEIPLCGHATLAASKIIFGQTESKQVTFETGHGVKLVVKSLGNSIEMKFPVYSLSDVEVPQQLLSALGVSGFIESGFNDETQILMLEIDDCDELGALSPDFEALIKSHDSIHGVCVTAQANDGFDFHSRFFWPWSGGQEDPVTGGTHTFLAKFWAEKFGKSVLRSFQASSRTGQMEVEISADNELFIRGQAVVVLEGNLKV